VTTSSNTPADGTIGPSRLHWSSIIFRLGPTVRSAITLFILLAFARDSVYQLWGLIALIPFTLGSVVTYFTLTYTLDDEKLTIADGWLEKRVRQVPLSRIQHVELTQGPLQRLLGVAEVAVQSGGSPDEAEAALKVLALPEAEELRRRIDLARRTQPAETASAADVVLQLTTRDLVLCGLAQGRGWLVVGGAIALAWQGAETFNIDVPNVFGRDEVRQAVRGGLGWIPSIAMAVLIVLGIALLFRLLSVGWALVRLHGFTLTREGDLLRSRYGLLTRFSAAIPRGRVQLLTIVETPVMRLAGRAAVKVETAAKFAQKEHSGGAQWLAPVIERARIPALIAEVLPGIDPERLVWSPVAPRARARIFRQGLIFSAMAIAIAMLVFGWSGLALVPFMAALSWFGARGAARSYAYAVGDEAVAFRSGWLTRKMSIVRVTRVQTVTLSENWFDRRWSMASVAVDTAGSGDDTHRVDVDYLQRQDADRLFVQVREAAARVEPSW